MGYSHLVDVFINRYQRKSFRAKVSAAQTRIVTCYSLAIRMLLVISASIISMNAAFVIERLMEARSKSSRFTF